MINQESTHCKKLLERRLVDISFPLVLSVGRYLNGQESFVVKAHGSN